MIALAAVVVVLGSVLVALGAVAVTRHRAASAADQGALAAAARSVEGSAVACATADRVVAAAGARLARCTLVGDVAEVAVELRPEGTLGRLGTATALARAGPAQP